MKRAIILSMAGIILLGCGVAFAEDLYSEEEAFAVCANYLTNLGQLSGVTLEIQPNYLHVNKHGTHTFMWDRARPITVHLPDGTSQWAPGGCTVDEKTGHIDWVSFANYDSSKSETENQVE